MKEVLSTLVIAHPLCRDMLIRYLESYRGATDTEYLITRQDIEDCNYLIQHYTDECGYVEPSTYLDERYDEIIHYVTQLIELGKQLRPDWMDYYADHPQSYFQFKVLDELGTFAMSFYTI